MQPTTLSSNARVLALATLLAAPAALPAQQASSVHPTPPPVATAARREGAVTIDGRMDEAAWQQAKPISAFTQRQPNEGAPASLATEVRILFDGEAIYVGARMSDPLGVAGIRAPLARRDQLLAADGNNGSFNSLTTDKIAVVLDPYHNHLDEAWFEINPAGVRGESYSGDISWDPIWEGATTVDANGWTAEMRIPYSQLRFSRDTLQTWGLQLWRFADRLNEQNMWSFRRRSESGGPAYYGHLEGISIRERPRQLEVLPYVVSRGQFREGAPGDPYHRDRDMGINAGADLKYLLTSNLTLDATFNPDFGQVEVDPASLNLSAYETFYDEKRPFFVANRGAFGFGGLSCFFCSNVSGMSVFYSRRIGRPPQLNGFVGDQAEFADSPDDATILGAAKITGRTKSGYTIGVLDAVANRETARYVTTAGGPELEQQVEPLTNYFVGRVRKDLRQGATTVGAILTSTVRRLDDDPVLESNLRSNATAVGLDWSHAWRQRVYRWRGSVVASDVRGSPAAIAGTQESSTHYYQRPDREVDSDGLFTTRYDTLATSMRGYGLYSRLAKENGNWLWEVAQNWRSPGFEVNDLAFLSTTDYKWMNANLARQWTTPTSWYRNIFTSIGGQQQLNYDGDRTDLQGQFYYGMEFPNYWNFRSFYIHHPTTLDDRLTRGGPVVKRTGYDFYHLQTSTDPRQRAVFDLSVEWARGIDADTRMFYVSPGMALKPMASVFIQLSPYYVSDEEAAQYVTSVEDPTAASFSGSRYVFSFIRTKTVSMNTRINWTLKPDLTLQLFAQPFFASGSYSGFREFEQPRTVRKLEYGRDVGSICPVRGADGMVTHYDFNPTVPGVNCSLTGAARDAALPFNFSNPDFTVRSLRGTAVLRYEYRPGSTLFFVWTQQRSGDAAFGDFDFRRDYRALWGDKPDNVFLVKATYWIGR
jgi:hypothetical protein